MKRLVEPRSSDGFLLFSKPSYMPGDTVMLKAFVLTGKNKKPYQGETDLRIDLTNPWKRITLATLKPYAPGGYTHSFVLADTLGLRLDNRYRLTLTPSGRSRDLVSSEFRYEYYDLKSMKLVIRTPDSVLYRGKSFMVGLKALNENDMILPDARVTLHILRDRVDGITGPFLPIRDTIAVIRENLRPSGETVVVIPDSIFPAANMTCKIVAVANTSDNESVTETKTMTFIDRKEEICYSTSADSVKFYLKVNGTETEREAELTTADAFGNKQPVQKSGFHGRHRLILLLTPIQSSQEMPAVQSKPARCRTVSHPGHTGQPILSLSAPAAIQAWHSATSSTTLTVRLRAAPQKHLSSGSGSPRTGNGTSR